MSLDNVFFEPNSNPLLHLAVPNQDRTSLNLLGYPDLMVLDCCDNKIRDLNCKFIPQLTHLACNNNKLTELNLSANSHLEWLWCSQNTIGQLDLGFAMKLTHLMCYANPLEE